MCSACASRTVTHNLQQQRKGVHHGAEMLAAIDDSANDDSEDEAYAAELFAEVDVFRGCATNAEPSEETSALNEEQNRGRQLLGKLGWTAGSSLGKSGQGSLSLVADQLLVRPRHCLLGLGAGPEESKSAPSARPVWPDELDWGRSTTRGQEEELKGNESVRRR